MYLPYHLFRLRCKHENLYTWNVRCDSDINAKLTLTYVKYFNNTYNKNIIYSCAITDNSNFYNNGLCWSFAYNNKNDRNNLIKFVDAGTFIRSEDSNMFSIVSEAQCPFMEV